MRSPNQTATAKAGTHLNDVPPFGGFRILRVRASFALRTSTFALLFFSSCASSPVPEDPILSRLSPPPLRARNEGTPFRIAVEKISILYEGGEPEEVVRLVDRLFPGHGSGPADALLILALGDRIRNWADEFALTPDECRFAGDEAYVLATRYRPKEKLILCAGPTPRALAYALVTLERSTRKDETGRLIVPVMTVVDAPATSVRGMVENSDSGWTHADRLHILELSLHWKINHLEFVSSPAESAELAEQARRNFVDLERVDGSVWAYLPKATLDLRPWKAPQTTFSSPHLLCKGFPEASQILMATRADALWNPGSYSPTDSWRRVAQETTALSPPEFSAFARITEDWFPRSDETGPLVDRIREFFEHGRCADLRKHYQAVLTDVDLVRDGLSRRSPALVKELTPWLDWRTAETRAGLAGLEFLDAVKFDADPALTLTLYREFVARTLPETSDFLHPPADIIQFRSSILEKASNYFGLLRVEDHPFVMFGLLEGQSSPSRRLRLPFLDMAAVKFSAGTDGTIWQFDAGDDWGSDWETKQGIVEFKRYVENWRQTIVDLDSSPEWKELKQQFADLRERKRASPQELKEIEQIFAELQELKRTSSQELKGFEEKFPALQALQEKDRAIQELRKIGKSQEVPRIELICVIQDETAPFPPNTRIQLTPDGSRWEDVARLDRPVVRLTFRRRPAKGFRIWVDKPLEKEARLMKVGYRWAEAPNE